MLRPLFEPIAYSDSGIAYAFTNANQLDEPTSILDWPGKSWIAGCRNPWQLDCYTHRLPCASLKSCSTTPKTLTIVAGLGGSIQPKVPTIVSYDPKQPTSFTWGAQKHKYAKIEGIKLLLDPGQKTPLHLPETKTPAELRKLKKSATDVVTDYITAMYKHALNRIETKIPAGYLKMCQKKFVVTVPAVWSAKAVNATLSVSSSIILLDPTLRHCRLQKKRALIRCR